MFPFWALFKLDHFNNILLKTYLPIPPFALPRFRTSGLSPTSDSLLEKQNYFEQQQRQRRQRLRKKWLTCLTSMTSRTKGLRRFWAVAQTRKWKSFRPLWSWFLSISTNSVQISFIFNVLLNVTVQWWIQKSWIQPTVCMGFEPGTTGDEENGRRRLIHSVMAATLEIDEIMGIS